MQDFHPSEAVSDDAEGTHGHTATYFRNARGTMVHLAGCRSQTPNVYWWNWAEGKTVNEIISESARQGITHQWCKRCFMAESCPTCHNQFEGRMPGWHYGSNWDWVPCQTCNGTGFAPISDPS